MALDPRWTATVDNGLTNSKWDEYDAEIRREVGEYNRRFSATPGYSNVDWYIIKAVVWVESGGPSSPVWSTRPMQIGNPGDPGYTTLMRGDEGSTVIMSDQLVKDLHRLSISTASLNIRAGIAYLFTRMVKYKTTSIDDTEDTTIYEYKILPGDSFDKIANNKKVGTTVEVLRELNPKVNVLLLRPGQIIKYRKARLGLVITGWKLFSSQNIAMLYNSGYKKGDPNYAEKLAYVLGLFKILRR
jgi:hypothetical protein